MKNLKRKPTLGSALGILITLITVFVLGMQLYNVKLQTLLLLGWLIIIPFGIRLGHSYEELEKEAFSTVGKGLQALMILLSVGALVGAWIGAGTVPTLLYYGLKVINPKFFLVSVLLFSSVVSLATGTSWGTIGTAGIAMMGIGAGLGIPAGMTAGAVISGAVFGDKMSPLSDSTNLAPAVAGTDLITHIKHMVYTTAPAYVISAIVFLILGFKYGSGSSDINQVNEILRALDGIFNIGIIALLPAILVMVLLLMKKPPIPSMLVGSIAGVLVAIFYQGQDISIAFSYLYSGFHGDFGNMFMDKLLNRGGITSMLGMAATMIFALGLGGLLNYTGILTSILDAVSKKIRSTGALVASTMFVSYFANAIGASMTFAAVITGSLMRPLYEKFKLKPENLSRIIEDAGTLGAVLIPWNLSALFIVGTLQVSYIEYVPFCLLSFLTPVISLIYGFTGITMKTYDSDNEIIGDMEQ